ncbi:hypothetical protein ABZ419_12160 [Streptomyces cinnamoneus]|uniref:hypothetical protein n=1 Tax=Streptomyces cinnamoneus TaxID=53446 RepID=UPI0034088E9E
MTVNISAIVLLLIATFFLLRSKAVGFGSALVLFLLGFFTAGTGAYGPIHDLCTSFAQALANLRT